MKRKLVALLATFGLTVGAFAGFSSAAFADGDAPDTPAATDIVATEPVVEPVVEPIAEPAPEAPVVEAEPPVEPAPAEPAPVVEAVPEETPVDPVVPDAPASVPEPEGETPTVPDVAVPADPAEPASDDSADRQSTPTDSVEPPSLLAAIPIMPVAEMKVWVCKFVASDNAPGGFVLKSGKQPIEVSVNALDDETATGPGATFSDKQPSFVVSGDDVSLCRSVITVVSESILCPTDDEDGVVEITTTTTTYYGSTEVDVVVEYSERPLTEQELADCDNPPPPPEGDKVWVCKFVASENSPGGYVLKAGKNPIEVSVNALDDETATGPGATFSDKQPSFVVPTDDVSLCVHVVVTEEEEIVCPSDEEDGIVNITTTTRTYYGTTLVQEQVDYSTRPLTEEELAECDLPTFDLVLPLVTFRPPTCTAAGSYTLGAAEGYDPALLEWTVNGEAGIPSGTYPASSPSIVTIVANAVGDAGLEPEWTDPDPYSFSAALGCSTPSSAGLAMTGSTSPYLGAVAGAGLVLLGGAAALMRRRAVSRDR
jgi:hypothetical protein